MRAIKGLTLIELMVVVVILVILAGVALPLYTGMVQKYRRNDASAALGLAALEMESCRSRTMTFTGCGVTASSPDGYYTIAIVAGSNTGTAYALSATPVAGRSQAGDDDCTSLGLTSAGTRSYAGEADSIGDCWR